MPVRRPRHILIVDAQSDIRDLLLCAFLDRGFTFSFVDDPFAAKLLLALLPVDLIVVDPLMLRDAGGDFVEHAGALGVPLLALPGTFTVLGAAMTVSLSRRHRAAQVVERVAGAINRPQALYGL